MSHKICEIFSALFTEGVSGDDGRVLSWCANTKLVLSKDPEYIFLEFDQSLGPVSGVLDSGRQPVPDLAVSSTPLNNIIGYSGATIITWRVPGQETGIVGDLRNVKGSGRTWLIWVGKSVL